MTFEEVRNLQISNIIGNITDYQTLVKECLSIVPTSTLKDNEIAMWISAAVEDMVRQDINVSENLSNGLVQGAIVMFVKSNFGMCDISEKELASKTYKNICTNLSLSAQFRLEEVIE